MTNVGVMNKWRFLDSRRLPRRRCVHLTTILSCLLIESFIFNLHFYHLQKSSLVRAGLNRIIRLRVRTVH